MGYNTTFVVCNDQMVSIDEDPVSWWHRAKEEAARAGAAHVPVEFGFRRSANGFWAASSEHADRVSVLLVGGNYVTAVDHVFNGNNGHRDAADQIRILRMAVAHLGFDVVPRRRGGS